MPAPIGRDETRRLVEGDDAIVAEVLPRAEYDWAHIDGAVHLPLKRLSPELADQVLDHERPVIVYCHDYQCDMSPRAAWRLEAYGFDPVYDYVAGKADWLAFNLPRRGTADLAGDHLITNLSTCSPNDRLGDIQHLIAAPLYLVVVLNHLGIVVGIIQLEQLEDADHDTLVEGAMLEGPTTVRPSEETEALTKRMRSADVDAILVSSSDGKLLGLYQQ